MLNILERVNKRIDSFESEGIIPHAISLNLVTATIFSNTLGSDLPAKYRGAKVLRTGSDGLNQLHGRKPGHESFVVVDI